MRTKAVVKLVAPYTRFRLDFIAKRLKISIPEVQDIVGFLIMDQKLRGKINQDAGTVEIESRADQDRMHAVAEWTTAIRSLAAFVLNEGEGSRPKIRVDSDRLAGLVGFHGTGCDAVHFLIAKGAKRWGKAQAKPWARQMRLLCVIKMTGEPPTRESSRSRPDKRHAEACARLRRVR